MMMKKFLMILMIPLLMMTINSESARAASLKDTPRLAILPYMDKSAKSNGLRLEDVTIVSEFVMEKLLDSGRFKIIEREKLKEIREEQKLSLQELSDPRFSIAIGKMASAQYLIAGSITGLSTKETGLTGSGTITNSSTGSKSGNSKGIGINAGVNKYTVIANITLRIIDLEDGTVVMAVSGTGESSIANVDFSLKQEVVNYFGEEEKLENPPTTGSTTPNNNQTNSDPATSGEDNQTNSDPATSGENNQTNSNPQLQAKIIKLIQTLQLQAKIIKLIQTLQLQAKIIKLIQEPEKKFIMRTAVFMMIRL